MKLRFLARIELVNGARAGVISNGERSCSMPCSVHQGTTETSKASEDHSKKQSSQVHSLLINSKLAYSEKRIRPRCYLSSLAHHLTSSKKNIFLLSITNQQNDKQSWSAWKWAPKHEQAEVQWVTDLIQNFDHVLNLNWKWSVCAACGIDTFMDIREDLAGSTTMIRHRKVTTPKVITIGILPRMIKMMRERKGDWLGFDGWWSLLISLNFNRFILTFFY